MNTSTPQTAQPQSEAMQIKIVADSAGEAVKAIQEKFGGAAKVLSVTQLEAEGLKRFMKKPRLQILVEVPRSSLESKAKAESSVPPSPEASKPTAKKGDNELIFQKEEKIAQSEPVASKPKKPIENLYSDSGSKSYFSDMEKSDVAAMEAPLGTAANPVRSGTMEHIERAVSMLRSVGFDDSLIERIRYELNFSSIGDLPTMEIYSRICDWLRSRFPKDKQEMVGERRAFIGGCGVGKTAALCKVLSADVFVNGLEPAVLKIDGSIPNPSDGLEAFCDIVGVPLYRSMEEAMEDPERRPLYLDLPGVNFADAASVAECSQILEEMEVDECVVVVNAAYETELIAESIAVGNRMGAKCVVFSHMDEARRAGKLWKFALNGGSRPLFFSYGPNPAGDYTMDPYSYLLEKTFPQGRSLASAKSAVRKPVENEAVNQEAIASA
ncbi:MAG: flagellar biosynthesis GTPase FlhF [Candidatus Pelagisphaera sp.]|jgi:flagellar biosynthesis GTPase FlhF